jgi:hypothetical protein
MVDYNAWLTLIGFLSLLATIAKLWWDNRTIKEGMAALYKLAESNQKLIEVLATQLGQAQVSEQEGLALKKNRLELDRLKTWGKALKWIAENS